MSEASTTPTPTLTATVTVAPTATPRTGGAFRFGLAADACGLDPWNVADPNSLLVTRQIFETLVEYGEDLTVTPALATQWQRSADGREWTFTLREGVSFHDGTPFNADAVAFNFERARSSGHPQRGRPSCDRYAVYQDLFGGFDADSVIAKVEAIDRGHVRFTTQSAFAPLLAFLAAPSFAIVSPRAVREDPDAFAAPGTSWLAGTGPFVYASWQPNEQISLRRHGSYWRKDPRGSPLPYLDAVTFRVIPDTDGRVRALKSGVVDAATDFGPADVPSIAADPNLVVVRRPPFDVTYLGINASQPPFDKPAVRRAIAMAINKRAIADTLYGGYASPAAQFVPPRVPGYDDSVREFAPYDPTTGRRVAGEAGLPLGFESELWYPPAWRPWYPDPKRVAELFAADLARIGINAHLTTIDLTTYHKRVQENEVPLWVGDFAGDAADAHDFLCSAFCPRVVGGRDQPTAAGAWSNPVAWRLLRDAASATNDAVRPAVYQQISKIVRDEVPRVPLFHVEPPLAMNRKVQGYVPQAIGTEAFTLVVLAR